MESFSKLIKFGFLCNTLFLKVSKRIFTISHLLSFSCSNGLFDDFFHSLVISCAVEFPIESIKFRIFKFKLDIMLQILLFEIFPLISEHFYCWKSKLNLFWSKLSILTKGIQTNDKLSLFSFERGVLKCLPGFGKSFVFFSFLFLFELNLILFFFKLLFLNFLLSYLFRDYCIIIKSSFKSSLKQAWLVLKSNSHKRSKFWNSIVMNTVFSYNFWYNDMLWNLIIRSL